MNMITNLYAFMESLQPEEYHVTGIDNVVNIVMSDTLNLSGGIHGGADNIGGSPFFLSLSRTASRQGYHQDYDMFCRIVFDGNKLNANYRSVPVDYWNSGKKGRNFEYEDRLLSDKSQIKNVSRYIKRIEVLLDMENANENYMSAVKELLKVCKQKNIHAYVYANRSDMDKKVNPINDRLPETDGGYEPYSRYDKESGIDYDKLAAVMLYDIRFRDDYDGLKSSSEQFASKYGIDVNVNRVHGYIRSLLYNSLDFKQSLDAMMHNYFKGGYGGKFREFSNVVWGAIKKSGCSNIMEFIDMKVNGILPKKMIGNVNADKYVIQELNYDGEWVTVPSDTKLKDMSSSLYFNTYKYGGHLSEEDMNEFFDMRNSDKTIKDFLKYLVRKYTLDKVKSIINDSGYDSYDKTYKYKLT